MAKARRPRSEDRDPLTQAIIDGVLERLDAEDRQRDANRQAFVAMLRRHYDTDRAPPAGWARARARRTLFDALHDVLHRRLAQLQKRERDARKVPLPELGAWVGGDALEGARPGRPRSFPHATLMDLANWLVVTGEFKNATRALVYLVSYHIGQLPEPEARSRAQRGVKLTDRPDLQRIVNTTLRLERLQKKEPEKPPE